jgi:asparagine synthase (glutamine-hydrolysing)
LIIPQDAREPLVRECTARMITRGPDETGFYGGETWAMGHQRLSIMDPEHGHQPIVYTDDSGADSAVVANGEIYNFRELRKQFDLPEGRTGSDSEVLLQLYQKLGPEMCTHLNGIFGFVVVSEDGRQMMAARDHCGIKPLYIGYGADGRVWFASELKSLVDQCERIDEFPEGHYWTPDDGFVRWYRPEWDSDEYVPRAGLEGLREALKEAVRSQCMSDVPFGLLLSGGLDSAVVGLLLKEVLDERGEQMWTYTIGQEGSPDVTAARMMAEFLGSKHEEYLFESAEAFDVVEKVIYHLETYEPELIRSAIPNYFLARLAGSRVKMVLTGEGSDELFGGYLYFRDAPDETAFFKELRRIFGHLHNVNCQRADRMTMAHALEGRVPFLDPNVIDAVMAVDPALKMINGEERPEKWALRTLFEGEIPDAVLWRTKAMQCEGVGMNWVAELQAMCEDKVSDEEFATAAARFPLNTPHSKEEYYYRSIFDKYYSGLDKFIHVWEGGCRAAGAEWKSDQYTRAGLANVAQLGKGLGKDGADLELAAGKP